MTAKLIRISSYLLTYPACCDLAYPERAASYLAGAQVVASLDDYTDQMWCILSDVILSEWFQIRIRGSNFPWNGPVHLPSGMRLLNFLDRTNALKLQNDIRGKYQPHASSMNRMSIFAAYGLHVPDDLHRELQGMEFLARQADYLKSHDHYILIAQ